MHVMLTGADSGLARALARRLLAAGAIDDRQITELTLVGESLRATPDDPRVSTYCGAFDDRQLLQDIASRGVDVFFHFFNCVEEIPGIEFDELYAVNLIGSLKLLNHLRSESNPVRLIFASGTAVYGRELPEWMNESTAQKPSTSLGAQQLIIETLIEDLSRRGELDGRSVRLPSVLSMDDESLPAGVEIIRGLTEAFAQQRPYYCPVPPGATGWWMSEICAVDNLLHAANLEPSQFDGKRTWQAPILRLSVEEIVDALARRYGEAGRALINYGSDAGLEYKYFNKPSFKTTHARAAGFKHDVGSSVFLRNVFSSIVAARRVKGVKLRMASVHGVSNA